MKIIFNVAAIMLLASNLTLGQNSDLYVPLNIQKSFNNDTRSYNGKPGENYWQNKSDYKINVEILPDSSYLIGNEQVTYYNNSPDTLKEIVIRLYQDISKKGATRDWYVGHKGLNDGVKINYLIAGGDTLDVSDESSSIRRGSTNLTLKLNQPLIPNNKITIEIGWEFEIPKIFKVRMGNYGNGNFYIAYWYPEIAVYDDIDGWDRIDYQGTVEFYNDFSNYNVSIKVPNGHVVWATGELQNGKDVLRKDIYDKFEKAKQTDETIGIITSQDYEEGLVTSNKQFNIWQFEANNVASFAFAISKSFNWDGASVIVDKSTERRVLTDAIYPDSSIHWDNAAQYARASIEYMSYELPGYAYPYSHATSYCNGNYGGGMESPMMANNGIPKEKARHVGLIFHELAHNYFPFIMGTNERKYAWMDEGWASFLPQKIVDRYDPDYDYRKRRVTGFSKSVGNESELPPIVPSYSYKGKYLRTGFYSRPSTAYFELKELLGERLFKKALIEYMDRWNGKHPIPLDFFFTFNEVAGEDLTWFWKPWFYEFGYPDLAVSKVENGDGFVSATIQKIGNIPTHVNVTFEFEDGTKKNVARSARVWSQGASRVNVKLDSDKKVKMVTVGSKYIPDSVEENNEYLIH